MRSFFAYSRILLCALAPLFAVPVVGQRPELAPAEYAKLKAEGTLPANASVRQPEKVVSKPHLGQGQAKGGGGIGCGLWLDPDANYTLAMDPNDDFSSVYIPLQFSFNLYGQMFNGLYINNNGNVTFDVPWGTFTATPFPTTQFVMVAPFWGDVDTGELGSPIGQVLFHSTPTAFYINWIDVGYYNEHSDKLNNFQLILTDGTDPYIGVGNNVAFSYLDMQWTTGDASGGINGFGGFASVVGANLGDGSSFIQFGTFDQPGVAYDGPFGANDGVDWLDYKDFVFTTAVSTQNIPPIPSSTLLCDTLHVCTGELTAIEMSFFAPESGQVVNASSVCTTLGNYSEVSNTSGNITAVITSQFNPTPGEVGYHVITYDASDNGVPPLSVSVSIVIQVTLAPSGPPTVTASDTAICAGETVTLTANGIFDSFTWSNSATGSTVQVGGGTYYVNGAIGGCLLTSAPITITEYPLPQPVITGAQVSCGGEPSILSTTESYTYYTWSNGDTTPTITVGTGTYSVVVTDANGCSGVSASVNVVAAPDPTALFSTDPPSPQQPGTLVSFIDGSNGNGGVIIDWSWDFGNGQTSTAQDPEITFDTPGVYVITLTVTTADGCTDTYTITYVATPQEVIIPNVFSPNGDGYNDALEFANAQYYGNHLAVFSRWGKVVYETNNYKNNWHAVDISEGTYYFELTLDDGRTYTGHVTLLR